jgi:hypothetical protein
MRRLLLVTQGEEASLGYHAASSIQCQAVAQPRQHLAFLRISPFIVLLMNLLK